MQEGKLTISRPESKDGDQVCIELKDKRSKMVAEITIGMEEFAYAVTGMSAMKCKFELDPFGKVGLKE